MDPSWNSGNFGYGGNFNQGYGYDMGYGQGYGQGYDQSGYQMGYGQVDYSGYGQYGAYEGYGDAQGNMYQHFGGNGNFPGFPSGNPGMNPGRGRGAPGVNRQRGGKPGAKAANVAKTGAQGNKTANKKAKEVAPPLPDSPPPPPPPLPPPPKTGEPGEAKASGSGATPAPSSKAAGEDDMEIDAEEEEEEGDGKMTFKDKKMMSLSALLCHFEDEKKDAPAKKVVTPAKKVITPAAKIIPAKKKVTPAKKQEEDDADDDEDDEEDDRNVVTFEDKMAGSLSALLGLVKEDAQPLQPVRKYPKPSKGPTVVQKEPPKKLFKQNPTNPSLVFNKNTSNKPKGPGPMNYKNNTPVYGPHTQNRQQWNWLDTGNMHEQRVAPEGPAFATGQGLANYQYLNENQRKGLTPSGKEKSEINSFYKVPREAYSCPEDMKETSSKKRIARLAELVKLRYCKLCSVVFPNTMSSKQHYEGKRHFIKLRSFLKSGEKKDEGGVPLCCKVCNVIYCDEYHKNVHLSGKPHAKMVLALKQRGIIPFDAAINDPMVKGPAFKDESDDDDEMTLGEAKKWLMTKIDKSENLCAVCGIGFSSVYSALEHYHGKGHDKKLTMAAAKRKLTLDDVIVLGADEVKYECILCNAALNSRDSLNEHVIGMRHQNKLKARQIYAKSRGARGGRLGRGGRGGREGGDGRRGFGGRDPKKGGGTGGKSGIIGPKPTFGHPIRGAGGQDGGQGDFAFGQEGGQDGFAFGQGQSDGASFAKGQKRPWGQRQEGGGGYNSKYTKFIQFQPAAKKFQTGEGLVIMGPRSGRGGFQGGQGGRGGFQGGQGGYQTGGQMGYQMGGQQGFQDGDYQGYGDYQYQHF